MTIKEAAELLKLASKTVYSLVSSGELPAFKIRNQWGIRRADFERWMNQKAGRRQTDDEGDQT